MAEWFYSDGEERLGPVTQESMRELLQSGKVKATNLVWTEGMPDWKTVNEVPELRSLLPEINKHISSASPFIEKDRASESSSSNRDDRNFEDSPRTQTRDRDWGDSRDFERAKGYVDDRDDYDRSSQRYVPHRGGLILTFGILGLVLPLLVGCFAPFWLGFSIPATLMGRKDLAAINNGVMDPTGRGTTQAGYICGIIGMVIGFLMSLVVCGYIVFILGMFAT
jgi:hypothetical protein